MGVGNDERVRGRERETEGRRAERGDRRGEKDREGRRGRRGEGEMRVSREPVKRAR